MIQGRLSGKKKRWGGYILSFPYGLNLETNKPTNKNPLPYRNYREIYRDIMPNVDNVLEGKVTFFFLHGNSTQNRAHMLGHIGKITRLIKELTKYQNRDKIPLLNWWTLQSSLWYSVMILKYWEIFKKYGVFCCQGGSVCG